MQVEVEATGAAGSRFVEPSRAEDDASGPEHADALFFELSEIAFDLRHELGVGQELLLCRAPALVGVPLGARSPKAVLRIDREGPDEVVRPVGRSGGEACSGRDHPGPRLAHCGVPEASEFLRIAEALREAAAGLSRCARMALSRGLGPNGGHDERPKARSEAILVDSYLYGLRIIDARGCGV